MEHSANILVVEDDAAINEVVCARLRQEGHAVEPAFSGTEARLLLEARAFDLVITDLMLPGLPGEEVVKLVRARSAATPVIVASARAEVSDRIDLLALGADDYLVKPFDLDELVARVAVQLRRVALMAPPLQPASSDVLAVGEWEVDRAAKVLRVAGEELELTRTEFALVELLAAHPRQVFSKQALYEAVWGECVAGQESTISAHVSNLRTKLKPSGTDGYIQTVWGLGFRLVPPEN